MKPFDARPYQHAARAPDKPVQRQVCLDPAVYKAILRCAETLDVSSAAVIRTWLRDRASEWLAAHDLPNLTE